MTDADIVKTLKMLAPGKELDELIAVYAVGYKWFHSDLGQINILCKPGLGRASKDFAPGKVSGYEDRITTLAWSSDESLAMYVVNKMKDRGFYISIEWSNWADPDGDDDYSWLVMFANQNEFKSASVFSDSLPEAICKAAVLMMATTDNQLYTIESRHDT